MMGYSRDEIVGKHFTKIGIFRVKDNCKYLKLFVSVIKAKNFGPLEVEFRHKDGTTFFGEVRLTLLKEKGRPVGIMAITRDITDRKQADESLRDSEEKFRTLAEESPNMIFINKSGRVVYANKKCEEIMGYKKEEFYSSDFNFLNLIASKYKNMIWENFEKHNLGEDIPPYEYALITKKGNRIEAIITTKLITYENDRAILGIVTDITEKKKTEEELKKKVNELKTLEKKVSDRKIELEKSKNKLDGKVLELQQSKSALLNIMADLEKAQKELEILNVGLEQKVKERTAEVENLLKQKDEFINQLSHDLRTPLNPLVNLLPLLEKTEKDSKSKELFGVLRRSVNRMKNIVSKTLKLARLNAPSTKFDLKDINLWEEAEYSIKDQQLICDEWKFNVENKIDKNIFVKADKLQLNEVFGNLISNAVKYSPLDANITVDAHDDGDFVTVSIMDSGRGLTSEQINHIFDEFYKTDESRHELESTGLGLSICKCIVEKHGGRIWAESLGLRKGSTFYFTIPKSSSINIENVSEKVDKI
jgi:PAS domain S-box-containing protein